MNTLSILLSLLTAATYVSAHGFVGTLTVGGKSFSGNIPNGPSAPSVIRQISTSFPIKGAQNPALTCGTNSKAGSLIADANPGDNVTFDWKGGDLGNWPHNTGPMLTYMASCGATTCDKFDIATAKWFKIQQIGRKQDGSAWVQQDLMSGAVATASLPTNLAAGNYLLRHEIIALHLAETVGGAEFYASCSQLRVGGTETGVPNLSDLVSLPGAYTDSDPGIFTKDAFNAAAKYTFPGPAIATLVSGNGTSTGTGTGTASKETAPDSTSSSCNVKRAYEVESDRPRYISHVMRRAPFASVS